MKPIRLPSSTSARKRAVSRTDRLTQPSLVMSAKSDVPRIDVTVRPRLGLKPNRPHTDAGMRIDPPPSLACAIGTSPAATAAAAPPDEPAAERDRSHGLCVTPSASVSVEPSRPISDVALLPITANPAASTRDTNGVSIACVLSRRSRVPMAQRRPGYAVTSFTRNGTPRNGPGGGGARRARRRSSVTMAWMIGSSRAMRASAASSRSSHVSSPFATSSAWAVASRRASAARSVVTPAAAA
jgi:hypothetical protein